MYSDAIASVIFSILISVLIWLVISSLIANQFYEIAKMKGYSERKYWHFCFWLGVPGYLIVIALPTKSKNPDERNTGIYNDLPKL